MDETRYLRDQHGSILLTTVLAMLLLTVLALSLAMVGMLEGKIAVNHYALVQALHVADAGIEGVKPELPAFVKNPALMPNGWLGKWDDVLAQLGALCNPANSVAFSFTPAGGAAWTRTGANPTLYIRNNNVAAAPWETGGNCTDTDGVITIRADGRISAVAGAFGANQPVALDVTWQLGGSSAAWENAVNGGAPGAAISGNAMVYGGVMLTSTGGGVAWTMGGTSGIRNNYQPGAPSSERLRDTTRARLNPALLAAGDVSLNAGFYVKQGTVTFAGGATAGLAQGGVTNRKQTLDSSLANDFDPGTVNEIHADRVGPFSGTPTFPLLSDVVGGGDTRTWEQMLNQDGLHITGADLTTGCLPSCTNDVIDGYTGGAYNGGNNRRLCFYANMAEPPGPVGAPACALKTTIAGTVPSQFDLIIDLVPNPNTATLAVQGLIVFDNYGTGQGIRLGGLNGGGPESLGTIVYTGSATIFIEDGAPNNCTGATPCAGRLTIAADIVTPNASYPTAVNPPVYPPAAGTLNNLGFMADQIGIAYGADNTSISASNLTLTGLFYAQSQLFMCKQTETFGSLYSPLVTMGGSCQVPKIAAVKTMSKFVPFGMIGSTPCDPGVDPTCKGRLVLLRWREGTQ